MKQFNIDLLFKKINNKINKFAPDRRERNRYLIAMLALLFFMDYLFFCYHAEKNPFDIFPVFPVKDERNLINVYLPDIDGKSLIVEAKRVPVIKDKKNYVQLLFQKVIDGSEYENTSVVVPVECYIKQIWIYDDVCAIDVSFSLRKKNTKIISGSEDTFKEAISKTIKENIQSIKDVVLLDRGIPGKQIWELNDKS